MTKTLLMLAALILFGFALNAEDAKKGAADYGLFKMELAKGFKLAGKQERGPMTVYGFVSSQRADQTACAMVVTCMDFAKIPRKPEDELPTVADFLKGMLKGIESKRTDFTTTEIETVKIGDITFKKIEWKGKATLEMRGTMYACKKGELYICINAQDIAKYAKESLPLCEKMVKSLSLK